jgi:hypothetical protein
MNKLAILSFFLLISCGNPLPHLENIDMEKWRLDKNGCSGIRMHSSQSLNSQKEKLRGLTQNEIVELLGRPDQNELYKRNQKFFFYHLSRGKECGVDSISLKLSIRFNAIGLAKEVMIE